MFKSFFNKINRVSKTETSNSQPTTSEYGLSELNPILVTSIKVGYSYLNTLCSINKGLGYERIGSFGIDKFPNRLDKYSILLEGKQLCVLFIYAYHSENIFKIPSHFLKLGKNVNSSIFENISIEDDESQEPTYVSTFYTFLELYLVKNYSNTDGNVTWTPGYEGTLVNAINYLGFNENIESVINKEWKVFINNESSLSKSIFINEFISNFHNNKFSEYVPDYIKERNEKVDKAYHGLVETINRIQAWLDNDLLRLRIESEYLNTVGEFEIIKIVSSPFCNILLECDTIGRHSIEYNIDSNVLKMLSNNMASTLIRRIYEFTPGEMEPFVSIGSLHSDCLNYFENILDKVGIEENHKKIIVKRNEEKSINDMLGKLKLKDDIDDETRYWFNK